MKKKATIYIVDSLYHNYRIDLFLSLVMNISRNESLLLLKKNLIFINGICQNKKSKKVLFNDKIEITEPEEKIIIKENQLIPINILFMNEDFLIINKPPFISCHKANKNDNNYTIADFAKFYWSDKIYNDERYGIVHRLDKETSGILIIAKNIESRNIFIELFKKRQIEKTYYAFIEKGLEKDTGIINFKIMRDPLCPVKMTYSFGQGKDAETKYDIIEKKKEFDIVKCQPKTGRTHQIRIHFQAIGYPLLGDTLYGKSSKIINRHALHASNISFLFKNKKYSFNIPLWQDMEELKNK